jgi:hypothetical protein
MLPSVMANTPSPDPRLDRDLIALLDHALGLLAHHLTPEQRADLWQRAEKVGIANHIERLCSPEVQRVVLTQRPHVNPDGGQVGESPTEPELGGEGVVVAEGSGKISSVPTS